MYGIKKEYEPPVTVSFKDGQRIKVSGLWITNGGQDYCAIDYSDDGGSRATALISFPLYKGILTLASQSGSQLRQTFTDIDFESMHRFQSPKNKP